MKKAILTKKAPLPIGPYNQAISFNDMLFVSGQIPLDPVTNKLVDSGIVDETNMVMKNIAVSYTHMTLPTILRV